MRVRHQGAGAHAQPWLAWRIMGLLLAYKLPPETAERNLQTSTKKRKVFDNVRKGRSSWCVHRTTVRCAPTDTTLTDGA
jgi:hypothetical protein